MKELSVDHLLGIKYITEGDIQLIFETADRFKEVINRPIKKVHLLDGPVDDLFKTIGSFKNKLNVALGDVLDTQ
jgi:aspartate carbamoyltransferase catalytic subunit